MMPLAPKGGVARRSSLLGRCLTTPSVFVTQYYRQRLHKEPSSPVAPELPSFMRDETLLGRCLRRRRGGARSVTPSASYDPSGSQNLTNSANLGHFWISFLSFNHSNQHQVHSGDTEWNYFITVWLEIAAATVWAHLYAWAGQCQLASVGRMLLYLAAASGPGVLLSLKQTAPAPRPRSQPSSICLTCASLFVFSRLLDAADDIELCWRRSSIHARWINHSCVLRSPV